MANNAAAVSPTADDIETVLFKQAQTAYENWDFLECKRLCEQLLTSPFYPPDIQNKIKELKGMAEAKAGGIRKFPLRIRDRADIEKWEEFGNELVNAMLSADPAKAAEMKRWVAVAVSAMQPMQPPPPGFQFFRR